MAIIQDCETVAWSLEFFAVTKEYRSSGPAQLLLDRANSEFGLVYSYDTGTAVMAQHHDTDDPIYFAVSQVRAACSRSGGSCKKICILLQHIQLDLMFTTASAAVEVLQLLGRLAKKVGNEHFETYEATSISALKRVDFMMERDCQGLQSRPAVSWMAIPTTGTSEWASIYKTGKCSDFTIVAGGTQFAVHRVLLCTRSQYFNTVCDGHFTETNQRSIDLPEDAKTISNMLQEIYGVYNSSTGSVFTNFALLRAFEKECIMTELLALFTACDKYQLEPIKQRAAEAIIDRLAFIHDPLSIVDLACNMHDVEFPFMDRGLRRAAVLHLHTRLPAIVADRDAWKEYSENQVVLKALHTFQCEMREQEARSGVITPPASPTKKRGEA